MQLLNTLYVTTPESYLHLDNDTVRIEVDREPRLRVPLHHVKQSRWRTLPHVFFCRLR